MHLLLWSSCAGWRCAQERRRWAERRRGSPLARRIWMSTWACWRPFSWYRRCFSSRLSSDATRLSPSPPNRVSSSAQVLRHYVYCTHTAFQKKLLPPLVITGVKAQTICKFWCRYEYDKISYKDVQLFFPPHLRYVAMLPCDCNTSSLSDACVKVCRNRGIHWRTWQTKRQSITPILSCGLNYKIAVISICLHLTSVWVNFLRHISVWGKWMEWKACLCDVRL